MKTRGTRHERVFLVTSLQPEQADPARLLALNRGHWCIENRVHYVRDMAFDEDRCQVRHRTRAQALACVRNFVISVLRLNELNAIKATLRDLAAKPHRILALLGL